MDREHWFDALNKVLVQDAPRRGILRQAFAAAFGAVIGSSLTGDAARKRKKKRKRKPKKKRHKKPPQPAPRSCSATTCDRAFATPDDREYCEFICRQCDGDDARQFCIVEGDPFDPAKIAVCCAEGAECCGSSCCGGDPGFPGRKCCGGSCVNTKTDANHCGECGHRCAEGRPCVNGQCQDCSWSCCHATDSGVCVGPRECCTEACSTCVGGDACLRWRDGRVGGYCDERPWTCGVVSPPCMVDGVVIACCGDGYICTPTGCKRL